MTSHTDRLLKVSMCYHNHVTNLWKDYYLDHHDRIAIYISPPRVPPKTGSSQFMQKRNAAFPSPPLYHSLDALLVSSQSQHKSFSH
ncbi:hypothetical protein SCLCIDRAFT_23374 [Scleroderma citrinum Foug A]|uniref:Uncharacterized protein n=1 Tax=Scleroderma citrinum Foug A TaxID=1036808 RepID=A0A0C3AIF6_9AGAM|nr:hypothetical protein SCLCIDRAFT_23374 [Scleroderma citrinum Foug A]